MKHARAVAVVGGILMIAALVALFITISRNFGADARAEALAKQLAAYEQVRREGEAAHQARKEACARAVRADNPPDLNQRLFLCQNGLFREIGGRSSR